MSSWPNVSQKKFCMQKIMAILGILWGTLLQGPIKAQCKKQWDKDSNANQTLLHYGKALMLICLLKKWATRKKWEFWIYSCSSTMIMNHFSASMPAFRERTRHEATAAYAQLCQFPLYNLQILSRRLLINHLNPAAESTLFLLSTQAGALTHGQKGRLTSRISYALQ